jgi:hypothetical protein
LNNFVAFLVCLFSFSAYSYDILNVPKESYITYSDFLKDKASTNSTSKFNYIPSDWVALKSAPPLLAKYQIPNNAVLSISMFNGAIGDDLSNLNRWRSQIGLAKRDSLSSNEIERLNLNGLVIKKVELFSSNKYLLIYWLTIDMTHYFVKIDATTIIDSKPVYRFIESQDWNNR